MRSASPYTPPPGTLDGRRVKTPRLKEGHVVVEKAAPPIEKTVATAVGENLARRLSAKPLLVDLGQQSPKSSMMFCSFALGEEAATVPMNSS